MIAHDVTEWILGRKDYGLYSVGGAWMLGRFHFIMFSGMNICMTFVAQVKNPSKRCRIVHAPIVLWKYTNQNQFSVSKKSERQKVTSKKCYLSGFSSGPTRLHGQELLFSLSSNGDNYKFCIVWRLQLLVFLYFVCQVKMRKMFAAHFFK